MERIVICAIAVVAAVLMSIASARKTRRLQFTAAVERACAQ